jgi:hypothetical protein
VGTRARCGGALIPKPKSSRAQFCGGLRSGGGTTELRGNANTNGLLSFLSLPGRLPREVRLHVAVIDRRVIDATAKPQSFQAPYADTELEGYLKVWAAMHPDALIERLTPVGRK